VDVPGRVLPTWRWPCCVDQRYVGELVHHLSATLCTTTANICRFAAVPPVIATGHMGKIPDFDISEWLDRRLRVIACANPGGSYHKSAPFNSPFLKKDRHSPGKGMPFCGMTPFNVATPTVLIPSPYTSPPPSSSLPPSL
jgi:hypothetical protein